MGGVIFQIPVFALIFCHLLARKPNLENISINSNKFFHNFHLSESSFTCPRVSDKWVSTKIEIPSLLCLTSHYKVTNTDKKQLLPTIR